MKQYSKGLLVVFLFTLSHSLSFSQPAGKTTQQWNKDVLDSLLIVFKTNPPDDSNKVDLLHGIGFRYARLVQHDQAIFYHKQALSLSQQLKLRMREGKAITNIALSLLELGNYSSAIEHYQQAMQIAVEQKHARGIASTNNEIGTIYGRQGKYDEALKYFQTAKEKYKEANSKDGFAFATTN